MSLSWILMFGLMAAVIAILAAIVVTIFQWVVTHWAGLAVLTAVLVGGFIAFLALCLRGWVEFLGIIFLGCLVAVFIRLRH